MLTSVIKTLLGTQQYHITYRGCQYTEVGSSMIEAVDAWYTNMRNHWPKFSGRRVKVQQARVVGPVIEIDILSRAANKMRAEALSIAADKLSQAAKAQL